MAYSADFRQLVVDAYKKDHKKKAEIIRLFKISRTGLDYLLELVDETGSVEPRKHGGGRPSVFTEKDVKKVEEYLKRNPDATLSELNELVGNKGSLTSVFRMVQKLGYRLKKTL